LSLLSKNDKPWFLNQLAGHLLQANKFSGTIITAPSTTMRVDQIYSLLES
jgi:hypothetical protein